jgi:hypothetical protein
MKPPGPTTAVAFAPEAIYELKIDTKTCPPDSPTWAAPHQARATKLVGA